MQRATAALNAGRLDEGESALRRVVARDSGNSVARVRLAEIALERNDVATAIAAVQRIADSDAVAHRARLIEGEAWFRQNRLASAEANWLRARQINPQHPSARFWLRQLYGTQVRAALWADSLWEEYDRGQAGLEEMIQLMLSGLELKNFGANISRLRAAVAADPNDLLTRRALALHLLRVGQPQDALRELRELYEQNPERGDICLDLADCLIANGDAESLRKLLTEMPADTHNDWRFPYAEGCLAVLEGRPEEAIEHYWDAIHVKPYATNVHLRMAEAIRLAGNAGNLSPHIAITKATAKIEQLAPMLHTNGWDLDLISDLVRACEKLLLIEEARGWVRLGLADAPDDPFLLEARARLASLPATSSRNPPPWDTLEQSVTR
jgi:predicted Zn-dependent protease